jgi:predicted transcriptional regulator
MSEILTTRASHPKSVVRSLRLDEDLDKSLQKYALKDGISLNSLVNKALLRYVRWDVSAARFGGVTLAGPSLTKLMSYLSDDEVREYAHWVAENSVRDFVAFFFGEFTLHTLLKGLRLLADYGGHFKYEDSTSGHVRTVVLKHGRGAKWSIHYQEWVRQSVEKILGLKIETETTENQVTLRFPLSADRKS